MPRYDYECSSCGEIQAHECSWKVSEHPRHCPCGGMAQKQFPVTAILGVQFFSPMYDESLGIDVSGPREKKQILKAMGLKEAGDKVGGARDFDKHAPIHIKPLPPRGISLSDVQKGKEKYAQRKASTRLFKEQDGKVRRINATPAKSNKELIHVKVS